MILERLPEVQQLSIAEKFMLASELWDELEANPTDVPVSDAIIAEAEARLEEFHKNPTQYTTWEAVKQKLQGSRS